MSKENPIFGQITIPHCVDTIDETVAILREHRAAWLAGQESK